jgi:hypothetical protein
MDGTAFLLIVLLPEDRADDGSPQAPRNCPQDRGQKLP